jgi:nucleotide-binding universal stress UspA family protein
MTERLVPISISKILVAYDGSDHSKRAAELAVALALKWKAELYLVHVLEERKVPEGFKKYAKVEDVSPLDYFELVNKQLLEPAASRARAAGVRKVESISLRGDPANQILRAARDNNVDLIVLGDRGLGKFSRTFLGSVSAKVLLYAKCPCITVK